MPKKITESSRAEIINAIRSPLGFFTLTALIVEVGLGGIVLNVAGNAQMVALYGMIGTLVFLITVVALIGIFRPEALNLAENNSNSQCDNNSSVTLYEYISSQREDEIKLDGTQISTITINMKANADMSGYTANISSISKSLFPFTKFDMELLSYKTKRNNHVDIKIIDDNEGKKRWKLSIDPPLRKDEELLFTTKFTMAGHRVMCHNDLIEVARINKKTDSLVVKAWKKISVPTDNWSWTLCFPKDYRIKQLQPCVLRNGMRIKNKEVELETDKHFRYHTGADGKLRVELTLKRPLLFYGYGFAWVAPTNEEYDDLCQQNNILPYHGNIKNAQRIRLDCVSGANHNLNRLLDEPGLKG